MAKTLQPHNQLYPQQLLLLNKAKRKEAELETATNKKKPESTLVWTERVSLEVDWN